MSYQPYVMAAYLVFVVAMLWDWIAPRLQLRRWLRAARLQQARRHAGRPARGMPAAGGSTPAEP